MDDPTTEHGALIGVQMMTSQFAVHHLTDRMDEVSLIEIFEPVLIWVMGIGTTVLSSVGICKEIYLITVGLTEANVATVLAGWLSK